MAAMTCIQDLSGTFYLQQAGFCFSFTNLRMGVLSSENAWTHRTTRHYVMDKQNCFIKFTVIFTDTFQKFKRLLRWTFVLDYGSHLTLLINSLIQNLLLLSPLLRHEHRF